MRPGRPSRPGTDAIAIARGARRPIVGFQPGSPFVPLVLGPDLVPLVDATAREPWLAVLAGPVHDDRATDDAIPTAAAHTSLPDHHASLCYYPLWAALSRPARLAFENQMHARNDEYQTDFASEYFGAGLEQGLEKRLERGREQGRLETARQCVLALAGRHRPVAQRLRDRVAGCTDAAALNTPWPSPSPTRPPPPRSSPTSAAPLLTDAGARRNRCSPLRPFRGATANELRWP